MRFCDLSVVDLLRRRQSRLAALSDLFENDGAGESAAKRRPASNRPPAISRPRRAQDSASISRQVCPAEVEAALGRFRQLLQTPGPFGLRRPARECQTRNPQRRQMLDQRRQSGAAHVFQHLVRRPERRLGTVPDQSQVDDRAGGGGIGRERRAALRQRPRNAAQLFRGPQPMAFQRQLVKVVSMAILRFEAG